MTLAQRFFFFALLHFFFPFFTVVLTGVKEASVETPDAGSRGVAKLLGRIAMPRAEAKEPISYKGTIC